MTRALTAADFANHFDCDVADLPPASLKFIDELNFDFTVLEGEEHDAVVLDVLKRIENDTQIIADPSRQQVWHNGWDENLQAFIDSGNDLDSLTPKFLRENQPLRWQQKYIASPNPRFELDFIKVFRCWLYAKYFEGFESAYEFGCGTGFNLVSLGQLYPGMALHGFDFVQPAVDLVNRIAESTSLNLDAAIFDMTKPDQSVRIDEKSVVLTFGAIEQLGKGYTHFLDYLLSQNAGRYVHVEPTLELYDDNKLTDYLAASFHRKRGYTSGMLPRLRELEAAGKVKLEKVKRLQFGSLMMEGYTLIVWSHK